MNYTTFTATRRAKGTTHAMMAQERPQRQHARHLITNLFIAKPLQSANAGAER